MDTFQRAEEIDAHFDRQLYDGMPAELAREIEQERTATHERLANEIIRRGLAMPMKSERW